MAGPLLLTIYVYESVNFNSTRRLIHDMTSGLCFSPAISTAANAIFQN